jgi:hypothetical protein
MRKMTRLSLVAGASLAVVGGAMVATPSMAAPGGGECTLHGAANFHPGPGAASAPFAYDFTGALTNCGDSTTGPAGFGKTTGTITAGRPITIGSVTYQEPVPTGTGSCATGDTSGISFVHWSDGTDTVIQYTTKSGAAGVVLQGNVLPSYTLTDGTNSATITSTKYVGAGAAGLLAFEVADPTQCTGSGVTTAGIDGVTGLGTQS